MDLFSPTPNINHFSFILSVVLTLLKGHVSILGLLEKCRCPHKQKSAKLSLFIFTPNPAVLTTISTAPLKWGPGPTDLTQKKGRKESKGKEGREGESARASEQLV